MHINAPDSTEALYHLLTNTEGIDEVDVDEVLSGIIADQIEAMYNDRSHLAAQIAARGAEDVPEFEDVPDEFTATEEDDDERE